MKEAPRIKPQRNTKSVNSASLDVFHLVDSQSYFSVNGEYGLSRNRIPTDSN